MKPNFSYSHAKAHLLGEHSVVYGYPAIIAPLLGLKNQVKIKSSNEILITSNNFSGNLEQLRYRFSGIYLLIKALLDFFDEPDLKFNLDVKSNVPAKKGLGSSAAYAVAITKAFFKYFNYQGNKKEIFTFSQIEENKNHGHSSGGDTYATISNKPIFFDSNKNSTLLKLKKKIYLIIADSGTYGSTLEAVKLVGDNFNRDPKKYGAIFKKMGEIANQGKELLLVGKLKKFGKLMNKNQIFLKKLGVSTPYLEKLVQVANSAGALGAKLSGGGLGGCIVALSDSQEKADKIQKKLNEAGAYGTWKSKIL